MVHRPLGIGQVHHRRDAVPRVPGAWPQDRDPRRRRGTQEPVQGPWLLQGGPRHQHPADRLRREPAHAQRRGHHLLPDQPVQGDARRLPRGDRRVRGDLRARHGRGDRGASRPQGPLQEGARRRDHGVHRRGRSVRGPRGSRTGRGYGEPDPGGVVAGRARPPEGAGTDRRRRGDGDGRASALGPDGPARHRRERGGGHFTRSRRSADALPSRPSPNAPSPTPRGTPWPRAGARAPGATRRRCA